MYLKDFAYQGLLRYFERISEIPRPTYHEEKIAQYICDFASERGLEYYRDEANNVFVKLPATKGREDEPAILLQGHTDMVCEKNEDTEHDFFRDGLSLYEENGFLRARGTTLGADNGDAVAIMLYILDGAEGHIPSHPPIECLFTASEEVGLDGAKSFDYSKVSARRMINLDSADESLIIAGCAGGARTSLSYSPACEGAFGEALTVSIKGLAGGHSGEDIDKGRANANKLMGRVLLKLYRKFDIRVASINGGSKDNAIPRECQAVITTDNAEAVVREIDVLAKQLAQNLVSEDAGFTLFCEKTELPKTVMDKASSFKVIFLLDAVQDGIFEMNRSIRGLVEFSRNIGIVKTDEDTMQIKFLFLSRSPEQHQIDASIEQLTAFADMLGMEVQSGNFYPGWSYSESSYIRDIYSEAYRELYGKDIVVTTIHAGLECGIIKEKIPDMDIISCGPVVLDLHSPDEAMDIASFERLFTIMKKVLTK